MLSSRQQATVFVDKENKVGISSLNASTAQSSRLAGGLKTPSSRGSLLQEDQVNMRTGAGQRTLAASTATEGKYKSRGAATVSLAPGARVLVAKDGNNRTAPANRLLTARGIHNGKGKGKADLVYDECCLVSGSTLAKDSKQQKASSAQLAKKQVNASRQKSPKAQSNHSGLSMKTPARRLQPPIITGTRSTTVSRTPAPETNGAARKISPAQNNLLPSFSAFKTPSPNQLLRRRKAAGSPVPLHFNPTSLRSDGVSEEVDLPPPKPTLLEQLDAQHALIDDTQEVDCALRQAVPEKDLPVDLPFEMPNYRELDLLGLSFHTWSYFRQGQDTDMPTPVDSDDDVTVQLHEEPEEWPIFLSENGAESVGQILHNKLPQSFSQASTVPPSVARVKSTAKGKMPASGIAGAGHISSRYLYKPRTVSSASARISTVNPNSIRRTTVRPDSGHYVDYKLQLEDWIL